METATAMQTVRWFDTITYDDLPIVGGKNASLGEMFRELRPEGVNLADGFAVTAAAYRRFIAESRLEERIRTILEDLDVSDIENLQSRGKLVRQEILSKQLPQEIQDSIVSAYERLCDGRPHIDVAVRSSATAEDLPEASFAGQQETYLNVQGASALIETCRRCYASLFTDRAISYREHHGFDHLEVALSVGVQRMVRSDLATAGVMFSLDTETGFRDAVLINAAYGLGENVVQGSVNPDEFYVFKPTLEQGFRPIIQKTLGTKEYKLVYDHGGGKMVKNVPVPEEERRRFSITEDEILTLARWACQIERHYTERNKRYTPMDIEWAKDGITGELFILQARPETVQSRRDARVLEVYKIRNTSRELTTGRSVGEKIASGPVRVIKDVSELASVKQGDILVTDKTDPDWEPSMKRAAAIVTNRGGRTCHAAIVSRELGLPAIVGTCNATHVMDSGQDVTVSCAQGEIGSVYEGLLDFDVQRVSLREIPTTETRVMMNVANPDEALRLSQLPNDGVGLAREEFIINTYIKIHPLALLDYATLGAGLQREIDEITVGYENKPQFFVDRLAQGVGMIAAAFYPKDVIVRLSDFKTNEYANLIGGRAYEPVEENPMIGFRGASRYYNPRYRQGFELECRAMRKVRDEMGLTNLKLMIPFCRTIDEGRQVLKEMKRHGLVRGENDLDVYVMCEIPSNVILADQFAELFDGFSIGSNDLTQLVLGVDRDSEIVADIFDEQNDAVKAMIASVIRAAKAHNRKVGICGQAPSDFPEFTEFLVRQGIDTISLTPDVVCKTVMHIAEVEHLIMKEREER